jgi:hypothetical protein
VLVVDRRVHAPHGRDVDRAAERLERGRELGVAAQHLPAHHRRGLVGRKGVAIVREQAKPEPRDRAVGGRAHDEVHLAVGERAVEEAQVHRADLAEPDPVDARERGIAVGPLLELVTEGRGPLAGERHGVRDRTRGDVGADDEREAVVVAERRRPDEAVARVGRAHAREHLRRVGLGRLLQDRAERGACVLDVEVDLPRPQGAIADERAAQVEAPLGAQPRRLDSLRQQLAQDALLGEVLAADDHAVAAAAGGEGDEQRMDQHPKSAPQGRITRHAPPARSSTSWSRVQSGRPSRTASDT